MTKEQFIGLLRSPATINLNLISELEEVATRFPYFQNAHILLAKQYHGHENIRFESYLRKAAAYAPDRSILYQLIKSGSDEVIHINEVSKAEVADTAIADTAAGFADESVSVVYESAAAKAPLAAPQPEPVVLAETDENISIETSPAIDAAANLTETTTSDPRLIIEQRLKEINKEVTPASGNKEQWTEGVNGKHPEEKTTGADRSGTAKEEPKPGIKTWFPPAPPVPTSEKAPALKTSGPKNTEYDASKHSFSEWLKLKTVAIVPSTEPSAYFDAGSEIKEELPVQEKPKKEADALLDNFIKNEPRIVPARSEFYSPGNMARKSAVEHEDLISETLARIYAQQGNIRKAIEAYHRLILKNPEKSSYFAALIKDLEEKEH